MWFKAKTIASVAQKPDLVQLRKRAKILVIDDAEDALPFGLLRNEGYSVEHWSKVTDLRRLEEGDFDIIFLDIHGVAQDLGEEDGIGVLDAIKRTNPHQIVVAFSAHSFDLSKMAFWKKADEGLKKPVDFLTAKRTIDRMLERLTAQHFWDSICGILQQHSVDDREIARIERHLAKAIRGRKQPDLRAVFAQLAGNPDTQNTVITLAGRLLALTVLAA